MVWWRGLVVIAFGSYPKGRKFKSCRHHQQISMWPHGQAVKTPPFHGGIMGSNPVGVTNQMLILVMSFFIPKIEIAESSIITWLK